MNLLLAMREEEKWKFLFCCLEISVCRREFGSVWEDWFVWVEAKRNAFTVEWMTRPIYQKLEYAIDFSVCGMVQSLGSKKNNIVMQ